MIGEIDNSSNAEKVMYTYFLLQEEYEDLMPEQLADFAIESILSTAGREEKDGIRYLLSAKSLGIITEFSEEHKKLF